MSRLPWILALLIACGRDPHTDFVTPQGALDLGTGLETEGPIDNLVLNPNFTLPIFVNGVGVTSFTWDIVHDVDTPNGQPAIDASSSTTLLFRMVRSPMQAEVWISGTVAKPTLEQGVVLFTDIETLEDQEVELLPSEERIIRGRRWTRYSAGLPPGDGHGMIVIPGIEGEDPRICAPVVRVTDGEDGLTGARVLPSRPAAPRWRSLYRSHRPTELGLE
ncbi:MAG: hypothetical protein AAGA48_03415 [Myxococcota bacterium]